MRKFLFVLITIVFLAGCSNNNESIDKLKLENYAYIYQTITDNDTFDTVAEHFDMQVVMSLIGNGEYRYDIIIDNPQVAMYDIKMMAVENNIVYSLADKMMPSIGVFNDEEFNMVPYQVKLDLGFVKGMVISGTTNAPVVNLKIRITWKDYTKVVETKKYFNLTVDYYSQNAVYDNSSVPSFSTSQNFETEKDTDIVAE